MLRPHWSLHSSLLYNPNIPIRIFYFLVDTAFFGALAVGIIAAYRSTIIIKGRLNASPSDLERRSLER